MVQGALDIVDSSVRHATALEDLKPLLCCLLFRYLLDHVV